MRNLAVILFASGMILAGCTPNPGVELVTTPLAPSSTPTIEKSTATSTAIPESTTPTEGAGSPPALVTPVADSPAAGICDFYPGELVVFEIYPDIPSPRCARATPEQRLKVINRTDQDLDVSIGPYEYTIPVGGEQLVDAEFGTYLAPGVHRVSTSAYGGGGGPELWLATDP